MQYFGLEKITTNLCLTIVRMPVRSFVINLKQKIDYKFYC